MKPRELTELETELLVYCYKKGFNWAAFNGQSIRVFDTEEKPELNYRSHQVRGEDGMTILGSPIHVPGLFRDLGYHVIKLSDIKQQLTLL